MATHRLPHRRGKRRVEGSRVPAGALFEFVRPLGFGAIVLRRLSDTTDVKFMAKA
ncbi:hypothetical protein [Geitlerinema sp. PCC 7407]|uniref:hypothetical protein n=1 Tax=Geitlerinema sp. PCC 7407 TaxID=1173025 RepID=UPI000304799F|nr:hypothetical protein [Geitlerinema sp. PCC 7407]